MDWFRERKWTRDRMMRAMQRYGTEYMGQPLNISGWRQMAVGIANRYLDKSFGPGDNEDDEDDGDGLVDSIYHLQGGHGSHIAGMIYARLFGQGDMGTVRSRDQFRRVSMQWHRFLGMGAEDRLSMGTAASGKRVRAQFDVEREQLQRRRFERLHRTDIRSQLKQMMGEQTEFRGLQERVIRSVMRGEWPIVQITPTGGGKSLTFMLPAYCTPDGVTIVITPLVALENDMEQRCVRLGIDGYVWKSQGVQRGAPLVFVTPESAVTKGFRTFVERLHAQQKVDRVVVDECHTLLEWSKTFRPQIGKLGKTIQDFGVPVICLTATLKPTEEWQLCSEMGFMPARVRMFRERTTRRNIAYRVDVINESEADDHRGIRGNRRRGNRGIKREEEEGENEDVVEQRIRGLVGEWVERETEGKVIVYGGTIERVQRLATALGCVGYWNKAGTAKDKAKMMDDWVGSKRGLQRVIVATNALGLGVDVPDVRLVVHAGMPRDLRNFVQESGRGGRDGQPSKSVVVVRESWLREQGKRRAEGEQGKRRAEGEQQAEGEDKKPDKKASGSGYEWDDDAVEFAEGKRCRREVLDREMDGIVVRMGCEEGEDPCDVCQRQAWEESMRRAAEDAVDGDWSMEERREEEAAAADADYERLQRSIAQVDMEKRLAVTKEADEVRGFEGLADEWAGCCVVCKIEGKMDALHGLEECPRKGLETWSQVSAGVESVQTAMFTRRRFARYTCCFECGMPQAICRKWVIVDDDGREFRMAQGARCQYPGVLVGMYVGIRIRMGDGWHDKVMEMRRADNGCINDGLQPEESYIWLGGLIEWGGIQASRMCKLVYLFSRGIGKV